MGRVAHRAHLVPRHARLGRLDRLVEAEAARGDVENASAKGCAEWHNNAWTRQRTLLFAQRRTATRRAPSPRGSSASGGDPCKRWEKQVSKAQGGNALGWPGCAHFWMS